MKAEFKVGDKVNITVEGVVVKICDDQVFKERKLVDSTLYTVFIVENQSILGVEIPRDEDDEQIPMDKIS